MYKVGMLFFIQWTVIYKFQHETLRKSVFKRSLILTAFCRQTI